MGNLWRKRYPLPECGFDSEWTCLGTLALDWCVANNSFRSLSHTEYLDEPIAV